MNGLEAYILICCDIIGISCFPNTAQKMDIPKNEHGKNESISWGGSRDLHQRVITTCDIFRSLLTEPEYQLRLIRQDMHPTDNVLAAATMAAWTDQYLK
jgi:hypothetical protein